MAPATDYAEVPVGGSSSSSSSALPSWAEEYIQNLSGAYGANAWSGYKSSVENLANAPEYNEQARVAMNNQYALDIQQPTMDAINNAINSAAGQGVMNSSISGTMVDSAVQSALAAAQQQQTDSNVWAANQNAANLTDSANAWGSYTGMLGDYLGLTKKSSSSGSSWESPDGIGVGSDPEDPEDPVYTNPAHNFPVIY